MSRSCIRYTRPDGTSAVCLYCEPTSAVEAAIDALEARGDSVVTGFCSTCIARHHLDSMRGTSKELVGAD